MTIQNNPLNESLSAGRSSKLRRHVIPLALLTTSLLSSSLYANYIITGDVTANGVPTTDPSTWSSNPAVIIGNAVPGSLAVNSGNTLSTDDTKVGNFSGVIGTVNLTDPGTTYSANTLTVGLSGTGQINVSNGAALSSPGTSLGENPNATGTVNLNGVSSSWTTSLLKVGKSGSGTINLTNGATLTNNDSIYLGYNQGSVGTLNIDGFGSQLLKATTLSVGGLGVGNITISHGGNATATKVSVGNAPGISSSILVTGPGSNLTATNITLGDTNNGIGKLQVTNGGTVTTPNTLYLAQSQNGSGTLIVDGPASSFTTGGLLSANLNSSVQITHAGSISSAGCLIDGTNNSIATFTIDGAGSIYTNSGALTVGNYGSGTLNITHGGTYINTPNSDGNLAIGNSNKTSGVLNIDGVGSSFAGSSSLSIGYAGIGQLNISNGGSLNFNKSADLILGYNSWATGTAIIDGAGSKLSVPGTIYIGYQGTGFMAINRAGMVTCSTIILSSFANNMGDLSLDGLGSKLSYTNSIILNGKNTLTVTNGALVENTTLSDSGSQTIGYNATVIIDGVGSRWNTNSLKQNGNQRITSGGVVNITGMALLNANSVVDGIGSQLLSNSYCGISSNTGKLFISNSGKVTATTASNYGLLSIIVDGGSQITLNYTNYNNYGTTRFAAGPQSAPGSNWAPISAKSWTTQGNGIYQTLGGTWNSDTHIFTASAITNNNAGIATTIDCSQVQRIHVSDSVSTNDLYAAFLSTTAPTNLTFTASLFDGTQKSNLISKLATTDAILSAWNFSTTGYTTGDPVLLSFNIGSGYTADKLALWHFDGSTWSHYSAPDLNYFGNYANFTVTGFSGYAITATPVPEPASLMLLAAGSLALVSRRQK